MTPFERRLAKVEAIRLPVSSDCVRLRFWHSPAGMTDLAEQEAWLAAQVATDPEQTPRMLNVHFVRSQPDN